MWEAGLVWSSNLNHNALCTRLLDFPGAWICNWAEPGIVTPHMIAIPPPTALPETYVFQAQITAGPFPYGFRVDPDHW